MDAIKMTEDDKCSSLKLLPWDKIIKKVFHSFGKGLATGFFIPADLHLNSCLELMEELVKVVEEEEEVEVAVELRCRDLALCNIASYIYVKVKIYNIYLSKNSNLLQS